MPSAALAISKRPPVQGSPLIAVAAITALRGVGTSLKTTFNNASTAMSG